MTLKAVAKALCPPLLSSAIRQLSGQTLRFSAAPSHWSAALGMSSGYADPAILERVRAATRLVVSGHAAYERDSVVFDEPSTSFPLVAGLLRSAAQDDGRLNVIDVGGSLGSTYHQCRPFLSTLRQLEWNVVEQPGFVQVGREEFSTEELRFYAALGEVPRGLVPATFMLSSVLQYLEEPDRVLHSIAAVPSRHLLIDRTPVSDRSADRLCLQHAPKSVYNARYPCWIFSKNRLMRLLTPHWTVVSDYASPEGWHRTTDGLPFEFRGLILERRP